jgi:hypothetical protein
MTPAILNAMLGWIPILLGSLLLLSVLFRYPKRAAKYARLVVGVLGASFVCAGIHVLLNSK